MNNEIEWICPDCGFKPEVGFRNRGAIFYRDQDFQKKCPVILRQVAAGQSPDCQQRNSISGRILQR